MEIIGETLDDAVGEAFDKIAKMLKLPYPGGPNVDKLAKNGNPDRFKFPISEMKGYDFSFSGTKTSVLYFLQKSIKENPNFIEENVEDICAGVQKTLIDNLMIKFIKAAKDLHINQLAIAGGVSANSGLRKKMEELAVEKGFEVFIPKFEYCTDNAAMIAITAHFKALENQFASQEISPLPRIEF